MKKKFAFVLLVCLMTVCAACSGESRTENSADVESSDSLGCADADSEYSALCNPSVDYVVESLLKIPTILETEVDAEKDDSWINKEINSKKVATIYFSSSLIEQNEFRSETIVESGTKRGGSIDIFETEDAAIARNEYLAGFDGKGALDSGSHIVVGTIVIRTSLDLSKEHQDILTNSIICMLADGTLPDEATKLPIATPEPTPAPLNLTPYFKDDTIEKLLAVSGTKEFSMTTTEFDTNFKTKPKAVLFFGMDAINPDNIEDIYDYYGKVKCGGCIEIYEDDAIATNRNAHLLGYYLFDTTGGKHAAIGNCVILTSKELSKLEQERLVNEFTSILEAEVVCAPSPTSEPMPAPTPIPKPTIVPTETPAVTTSPPTMIDPTKAPTEDNPYNKLLEYSLYTRQEYAHVDSDVYRLGNGERLWITIEAIPSSITLNDFILDYDDTMIDITDISTSTSGNKVEFELTIKAKKAGVSDILICSAYDLVEDADNCDCYVFTVKGLDSLEGKVVYITSSGEKYHYSESCAGVGAFKTTRGDAQAYEYGACGKCAK